MVGPSQQADPSTLIPPEGMQDFYNSVFAAMGFPPSPRNPNRIQRYAPTNVHTGTDYGPAPRPYVPNRPDEGGSFAPDYIPYYPPQQSRAPVYTPPGAEVPMPSFMRNRAPIASAPAPTRQQPTDALARTLAGLDTEDDTGTETKLPATAQGADARVIRALDPNAGPRVAPNANVYQAIPGPDSRVANMTPSTGRAHMLAPVPASDRTISASPTPPPLTTARAPQGLKPPLHDTSAQEDSGQFLNNDPNDTRPGSLGEAKKLFPGQKLQQAIYYTQPERGGNSGGGGMQRLGVGADTSKLNPDYVSRIWEPAEMTGTQRFVRGAYETPGANPLMYDPNSQKDDQQMASGGAIDAAHKISREKATPCHTGLINMAVGGRTDHLPMHVREGSYVLPADIVSALGEGNTMAGSKVVDHMFAGRPAHKASGGPTIGTSKKTDFLQSSRTLPGDIAMGVNGEDLAGSALMANMFNSGPFGTSGKGVSFRAPDYPGLDQYSKMQQMFNPPIPTKKEAHGGPVMSGNRRPVPIVAAGGEYVIDPDEVERFGNGDINKGHDKLDEFVKHVRKHLVKTLNKLPGPRRD